MELISVVFSFRNEAGNIPALIARAKQALDVSNVRSELIFVNDCSNDGSIELLNAYAEKDKSIKILNMARRCGVSPCVLAGFAHASGDAVIYLDADLQDPPELIPKMIDEWRNGCDVVNTTRLTREGENPIKMFITKSAYRLLGFLSDVDIPMNTGDFKLLSRRVVNEVLKLNEYDPFLRGLVRWVGLSKPRFFMIVTRGIPASLTRAYCHAAPQERWSPGLLLSAQLRSMFLLSLACSSRSALSFICSRSSLHEYSGICICRAGPRKW